MYDTQIFRFNDQFIENQKPLAHTFMLCILSYHFFAISLEKNLDFLGFFYSGTKNEAIFGIFFDKSAIFKYLKENLQ